MWRLFDNLLGEVSVEVESTANGGKLGETLNDLELGVVGNLESTRDGLEHRHGNVGQVGVADERERATDGGQVGSAEHGELVAVETKRAVDSLERWEGNGGGVADGHVVGPDQVGEDGRHVVSVGTDGQGGGDVSKLHVDVLEVRVVDNVDGVNDLEIDSVQ